MSRRVHLIGICGTAMATLAALLKRRGDDVSGSDQHVYPPMSEFLVAEGILAASGYDADHIEPGIDLVVVGNAISRGNPELERVLELKIRYASLPEVIRDTFLWGAHSVVVAGTHGKTTTTSLAGWLLAHGGLDPTVFIGGIALNFGESGSSYREGRGRDFVIEGDEYDSAFFDKTAKFLKYLPDVAIVGNVEFDHADIYADLDAVRIAFRRLANLVPRNGLLLLGADSPHAHALKETAVSPVETFGLSTDADWQAVDLAVEGGRSTFRVLRMGRPYGVFKSPLLGEHNVRNALAAIAIGARAGVEPERLVEGLAEFRGIKRRLEVVGTAGGATVFDDFAHHPTAVHATLTALRKGYPGRRVWAVFEPRSASSCRRVFQEPFAGAFGAADEVVIAGMFRSNVPETEQLSVGELVASLRARGQHAREIGDIEGIVSTVAAEHQEGDLVVVMSNGGFGGIHQKLLKALAR